MEKVMILFDEFKPVKAHEDDAGLDLKATEDIVLKPFQTTTVNTGVYSAIPNGYFGMIAPRSGLNKKGITVLTGIIDSGYRGEIKVIMINLNPNEEFKIEKGDRIAQMIIIPFEKHYSIKHKNEIDFENFVKSSKRQQKGFGSSGMK